MRLRGVNYVNPMFPQAQLDDCPHMRCVETEGLAPSVQLFYENLYLSDATQRRLLNAQGGRVLPSDSCPR
jgi:hypothetical protein